jgi:diacylglycerol kinase family enzyme
MKQALVIFNPSAGVIVKQDVLGLVKNKLKELGWQPLVFILNQNFEKKLAEYDLAAVGLVVAVGGDGTAKVAARTIIEHKLSAKLALVPFGSANVLAATLKIPLSWQEAIGLLASPKAVKIDVGLINRKHYFVVGFSLGYVSSIIIATGKELKNRWGMAGYLWRLVFNKIRIRRVKFKIQTQNKIFWVKGNSLIVFNAFNFYGFQPKKSISISDGVFNLYAVTNKTFWTLLKAAFYVWWYHHPPRHVFFLDDSYFKITVNKQKLLKTAQVDGDHLLVSKEMIIETLPRAVEVVIK